MKRAIFTSLIFLLLGAETAWANEGVASLSGPDTNAQCFSASVLVDEEDYRLVMTCRNLIVPPETERLFYYAWARRVGAEPVEGERTGLAGFGRGAFIPLGGITRGKLSARIREAFEEVLITAETVARPREPNLDETVVSGLMQPISFEEVTEVLQPTPTGGVTRVTVEPTPHPTPVGEGRGVVGTAFRIFLGVLGVILAVAVVITFLQRRSAARS
jgi:hypothetical protein